MARNILYEQRKKFDQHKKNIKNLSRIRKLAISLGVSCAMVAGIAVPAFAATTNGTVNSNACFGQARSYYAEGGPNSVLGHNEGYYMSTRAASNASGNIAYRDNCKG